MKKLLYSTFLFLSCFFFINEVSAFTPNGVVVCYENTGNSSVYSTVSSGKIGEIECGQKVEVLETVQYSNKYGNYRYKIDTGSIVGYTDGCWILTTKLSEFAINYYKTENMDTYKNSLKEKGFPDSYIVYLLEIHARHPKWIFNPSNVNLTWDEVIAGENIENNNLVWSSFDENYRSTKYRYDWATNTFYRSTDEANWYNVSEKALKFYMDPRNYLNEKYIFAFEELGYNSTYHNASLVQGIMQNSFMPGLYNTVYKGNASGDGSTGNYATDIFNAGSGNKVSPIHLASRILQEVGNGGSGSSSGGTFTYCNGVNCSNTASGYYNFFNIKANGDSYGNGNIASGLVYAMGGINKNDTSYNRPWNSPYRSIVGGAKFLSGSYISIGQSTLYYEKFAVVGSGSRYSHQYQQNVSAPVSEGGSTFLGYRNISGLLDNIFVFSIPIYKNMPSTNAPAPVLGNPNYYLNSLKVNNTSVPNFTYNNTNYKFSVPLATSTVSISASAISNEATISGIGNIAIDSNNKNYNITVTAGNGDKITYTINIVREDDPKISVSTILNNSSVKYNSSNLSGINPGTNVSTLINKVKSITNYADITIKSNNGTIKTNDSFRTGDTVTITSNNETKTYNVVIRGDIDGDGEISKLDYLAVLRHYYGYTKYDGAYQSAADVNNDGAIDKLDYLAILRDYYGYAKISQ